MNEDDDEALLQQADALIKRHQATQPDIYAQLIPTLTDIVEDPAEAVADTPVAVVGGQNVLARSASPAMTEEQLQAISSDVYHRILQNLDIHTDEAIRRYLAPQLEGVLDRTLSGLLDELNHSIGGMVRDYIAQALDTELQNLRQSHASNPDQSNALSPGKSPAKEV